MARTVDRQKDDSREPRAAPARPAPDDVPRLAAALAHEVRNPLNTLSLTFQLLERLLGREDALSRRADLERHLAQGTREVDRIKRIVEGFVDLTRRRDLHLDEADVGAIAREAAEAELARRDGRMDGLTVALDVREARARVDRAELQRAVEEVIANAIEAAAEAPPGAAKRVDVACALEATGPRITVRDTGAGFSERALGRLFEPYFTTKPEHAGVGLARARAIVEAHGGRIAAGSRDPKGGSGAEIRIELTADAKPASRESP